MYTLWSILATRTDIEDIAGSVFGWAIFFLFIAYVFNDDKEEKDKKKPKEKKVKSWILLVFFSMIMITSFSAVMGSLVVSRTRSFSGAAISFCIFYLAAFGVKKMLNFRELFLGGMRRSDTKVGKRDI
ncbi:hypothetical protein [Candidatus Uabimicrobium amorphum]|uniref:Uncharacterized protein n=1 Tax=Uabimicrobium amorphum TaxID=2596890 RepID=A0A5S9F6L6_UABAM|nr:hypothetical protein [Candidatus Uabimicrobium amorphum]BBM87333.1 hypothetical protein UABAM_05742 [Candidatus Uabimicrobium amorphum]